jgi:hypothetical protein
MLREQGVTPVQPPGPAGVADLRLPGARCPSDAAFDGA